MSKKVVISKEDKLLLLKDLSARLPYAVKIHHKKSGASTSFTNISVCHLYGENGIEDCAADLDFFGDGDWFYVDEFRPYLFPLSSMTEEQKQYLKNRFCYDWDGEPYDIWKFQIEIGEADELIDWFNKNHFDFRGLIPKGLALDATDKNIY